MKRILLFAFSCLFAAHAHSQGGETCETATAISSLPYANVSSTSTSVDNYYAACLDASGRTGGKDRVYQYTTGPGVEYVDISLCEAVTNFDSKLIVYEGVCTGSAYACRDDGCQSPAYSHPYNSVITNLRLNPDTTYYIVVDGYNSSASGHYQLNVRVGAGMQIFSSGFETDEPARFHEEDIRHAQCSAPAYDRGASQRQELQRSHSSSPPT